MPYAEIDDVKINYHILGKGEPIIFISGLGMDHRNWVFQIPFFKDCFKTIIFDNRGIGKSTGSLKPYSIKLMADDTVSLLKYLEIDKAHIIGSSMGGMISQEIAINYPNILDKLILVSTTSDTHGKLKDVFKEGFYEILGNDFEKILDLKPKKPVLEKILNFFLKKVLSKEYIINNQRLINDTIIDYTSDLTYFETFLKQTGAIRKHNSTKRLSKIKSKTLIITGEDDKLLPVEHSKVLYEKISNSTLITIKNGSHGFHIEMPDVFNKKVYEFLKNNSNF